MYVPHVFCSAKTCLIDNIKVIDPLSGAVYASYICVCPALFPDLALQQTVPDCVLHLFRVTSFVEALSARGRVVEAALWREAKVSRGRFLLKRLADRVG
jgi:hypothetical protein